MYVCMLLQDKRAPGVRGLLKKTVEFLGWTSHKAQGLKSENTENGVEGARVVKK